MQQSDTEWDDTLISGHLDHWCKALCAPLSSQNLGCYLTYHSAQSGASNTLQELGACFEFELYLKLVQEKNCMQSQKWDLNSRTDGD
jgi:hypothetical protein